jgi:DNA-directed RNA polymerase subunit RPC12/RpoP
MAEGGVTPSYKCAACKKDIPNHPTTIERHNGGKSHKRIVELLGK